MNNCISLCMISRNDGNCIGAAIDSVSSIASQIVVALDDRSDDNTEAAALARGAEVYKFKFDHFGQARDYSIKYAKCDWILVLDGDEIIKESEARCLPAIIRNTKCDAFMFPRNHWNDLNMTHRSAFPNGSPIPYPDYQIRLFRNVDYISYGDQMVHEIPRYPKLACIIPQNIHIQHFKFYYKSREEQSLSFRYYHELSIRNKK